MPGELTPDGDGLYAAAVGELNREYYLSYFRRADSRGYAPMSWHWPAFLIGLLWLLYRRQLGWAAVYFLFPYLVLVIAGYLRSAASEIAGNVVLYASLIAFQFVYVPIHANAIYYRWVTARIEQARAAHPGDASAQRALLAETGGVSLNGVLVVLACYLVGVLLVTWRP